jgi:hypothetical protein
MSIKRYNLFRLHSAEGNNLDGETIAQTYAENDEQARNDFRPLMEEGKKYLILIDT